MLAFGISTLEQYARVARKHRPNGSAISYGLLQIGEDPTAEEIKRFEDISLNFRTSNGTTRMTFRQRLLDVDTTTLELLQQWHPQDAKLVMQDRAASNCLTSAELAEHLFRAFPYATDQIFLGIMVIGLLGLITDQLFKLMRNWLLPWAANP